MEDNYKAYTVVRNLLSVISSSEIVNRTGEKKCLVVKRHSTKGSEVFFLVHLGIERQTEREMRQSEFVLVTW